MSKNRTENPNIASGRIDMLEKDEILSLVVILQENILGVQQKLHIINLELNGE